MRCRYCGYENKPGQNRCAGCGKPITGERTPHRKNMILFGAALLLIGLVAGILIGGSFRKDSEIGCGGIPIVTEILPAETAAETLPTQPETLPALLPEQPEPEPTVEEILPAEDGKILIVPNPEEPESEEILRVVPMEDGSVAALYADGKVLVSGNPEFAEKTALWEPVVQMYYERWSPLGEGPLLAGLTEDGSVFTTLEETPDWNHVKSLHFDWHGMVGVTEDGRVLTWGDWEDPTFLSGLTNVETLVYGSIQDIWGCLKKDGNVYLLGDYVDSSEVYWRNVKELRDSGHSFYVIRKDGTVDGGVEESCQGLRGAVKIVDYGDWLFGLSADGRLLTGSGGNIYTNTGDMMVAEPGLTYYGGEVDIKQFRNIKDIYPIMGLVLLLEDGTLEHIGAYPSWDLENWDQIAQIYGVWDTNRLYGIRQDGSVIMAQYESGEDSQTETDNYRDWKLQKLYPGEEGVVGLTLDGKLVGDGIYENTDFSLFGG